MMYWVVVGLFLAQNSYDGLDEIFNFQLFEVFKADIGFEDNSDPSQELIAAFLTHKWYVFLPPLQLRTHFYCIFKIDLQLGLGWV